MANWTAYRAIKDASERTGWPLHYRTDLTKHDRARMAGKDAPEEFVWILRQCGTHLFELGAGHELGWVLAARTMWGTPPNDSGKRAIWYIYREGELTEVEPADAVDTYLDSLASQAVYHHRSDRYIGDVDEIRPARQTPYGPKCFIDTRCPNGEKRTHVMADVEIR